ncbi:universal stress protein [Natronobacterium gregoryi]|uniref:Universal stress protein UspA n=2 Tax=Natronobacterium gregoryi TaxID=44930 RepID=L0AGE7_NATGS|nr:universal stress protein [Natronobacterium gregoryi]AFZ72227.1 universal stress protein UspA-like protein [Natronobacterium gregoryi SP2]ELY62374.1 UspA domain-containing protein [Natronobacterium gregoryi SP2]PLK20174.1 universal stress protein UspA [Natronobacterium gregoryi SP2]SFJ28492.1 Nucleotide-binding universal stress protein, UspA family [Natronobacterium gregoryi]
MSTERLLVPIANPETADRLLDTAADLARDRDLEILVVTVVTVPMQLTLEQASDELEIDDHEAVLEYALERAGERDVSAAGRVRFGRSVADGILEIAGDEDEQIEAILLGWRGRPRRRDVVLGSSIDEILADAPCDVLVERIDRESAGGIDSILVPVAGGPNTDLAARIAGSLARAHDARVELVTVVSDRDEESVADARELLTRTSRELGAVTSIEQTVLDGAVEETILERTGDHDVTVVGAAESGPVQRVLVGQIPETIGREADSGVMMAKRHQDVSETLWRQVRDRLRRLR